MIASITAGIAGAGTPFPSKTHISSPAAAAVVGSCWLFPKHIVLDAGLHSRELPWAYSCAQSRWMSKPREC
jgi:hypothetical protein